MVTVVNLHKDGYTVYCGRPGKGLSGPFGNPFQIGVDGIRGECCKLFEEWFYSPEGEKVQDAAKTIPQDAVLGCFCSPRKCHAQVIADYVNNGYAQPEVSRFGGF